MDKPTHSPRFHIATYLAASLFMGLSNSIFDTTYNFYLQSRGISESGAGIIYAVATGAMAVAVIPLLFMGRFLPKQTLLVGSAVLYSAPFALLPLVDSVWAGALVLSLVLSGMLGMLSLGNTIAGSLVADHARPRLFSMFFVVYLGAGAIGSAIVSAATSAPQGGSSKAYKDLLLIAAVSALTMLVFRLLSVRGIQGGEDIRPDRIHLSVPERRNLAWIAGSAILIGASMALVFRFANVLFQQAFSLPVSQISLILGSDKLVSIIGAIFIPMMVGKLSFKGASIALGASSFLVLCTQTFPISAGVFIALYLIRLLLNYGQMPILDTLAVTGFLPHNRLASTGVRQSAFYLGGSVAAGLYGFLLGQGQWRLSLVIAATTALLGAVAMSRVQPIKTRK